MQGTKWALLIVALFVMLLASADAARAAEPAEPRGKVAGAGAGARPARGRPTVKERPEEPFSIEAAVEDLQRKFKAGGLTMWVILFLSVAALAFVLERVFRLRRRAIAPAGFAARADRLWKAGRLDELEAIASRDSSLLSVGDIGAWPALRSKLLAQGEEGAPGPSGRIWALLSPQAREMIQSAGAEGNPEPTETQMANIVEALNGALKNRDFYREENFRDTRPRAEARRLLTWDVEDLSQLQVQRLNRLLLEAVYPAEIRRLKRRRESSLGRIVAFIVRHRHNPINDVSAGAGDIASRDMGRHLMFTYPLAAIATLSPLLGLFGTVLGMIESFEVVAIADTMGTPSLLSSSISKALVTTAFGLLVAIPTLFFYHLFRLRTNYLSKLLEEEASSLLSEWLMKEEDTHEG